MSESVTFSYDFIASDTIALAKAKGTMQPADIKRFYLGLVAFSCTKSTFLLLADFRESSMNFDAPTLLKLVEEVGVITSGYKIARIYPTTDFRQYIIEEYAVRLDVPIRNFANEADAIEWLLDESENHLFFDTE
ncbi:hypothetical protein [Alteromonas lipolytica]|uniref:STAS/SEC14 domain-containing protein n=1 Tax=Alteromonas lipolytica TaxID=1856405 RepID=A0A1E8FI81_9ALTE|nr:hypothetical protein [Alteromonas lipolytica]OFI35604.1 hypothetical protein BFC17_12675 [Alteromonas lipolytica]GGF77531.1 hypothetical protein GCM10011338_32370 [Alteromonas lipolytica]